MEFQSPVRMSDTNYSIKIDIDSSEYFCTTYPSSDINTHTSPSEDNLELRIYLSKIANLYDSYSQKWFSTPVPPAIFFRRVSHSWIYEKHPPYRGKLPLIRVRQTWSPEQITILGRAIQIRWSLRDVFYEDPKVITSGTPDTVDETTELSSEIPFSAELAPLYIEPSLRSRARRNIRKVRLEVATLALKVKTLTEKYYEKYGNLEGTDNESILSSDSEMIS